MMKIWGKVFFSVAIVYSVMFSFPVLAAPAPEDPDGLQEVEFSEATASDALPEDLEEEAEEEDLFQLLKDLLTGPEGVMNDEVDETLPEDPVSAEAVPGEVYPLHMPALLSAVGEEHFLNALRYDVTVGGDAYTLLFSPSYLDSLYVDANGNLLNMSSSQIQGRVFDGSFDPYADEGTLVYLAPCLGNNFSANHNYGSPNWFREYYWSSYNDRLTYDDTYVRIQVDQVYYPVLSSDLLTYVLIFLVGGGVLLCWLNRFRRY